MPEEDALRKSYSLLSAEVAARDRQLQTAEAEAAKLRAVAKRRSPRGVAGERVGRSASAKFRSRRGLVGLRALK